MNGSPTEVAAEARGSTVGEDEHRELTAEEQAVLQPLGVPGVVVAGVERAREGEGAGVGGGMALQSTVELPGGAPAAVDFRELGEEVDVHQATLAVAQEVAPVLPLVVAAEPWDESRLAATVALGVRSPALSPGADHPLVDGIEEVVVGAVAELENFRDVAARGVIGVGPELGKLLVQTFSGDGCVAGVVQGRRLNVASRQRGVDPVQQLGTQSSNPSHGELALA